MMSEDQYNDAKKLHTMTLMFKVGAGILFAIIIAWLSIQAYLWWKKEDIAEEYNAEKQAKAIKADRKRNATFDLQTQAIDDYIAEQIEIPVEGETDHEIITTIIDRFPCAVDRSLSKACPPDGIRLPD